MAPAAAVTSDGRASSAHPSERARYAGQAIQTSMSYWSATTYTSVAPSTRAPTMSRHSFAASDSSQVRAFNDFQSRGPHNSQPELFGLEFHAEHSTTKGPQWLQQRATVDGCSTTVNTTGQTSLVEKFAIFVVCAFFVLWIVRSAAESIFTLVPLVGLVWLMFGGFQILEQQQQSAQPSPMIDDDDDRSCGVCTTGDIVPLIEVMMLDRQTAHEESKVPQWLASFRDMSVGSDQWMSSLENEESLSLAADIAPSAQGPTGISHTTEPQCEIVGDEDVVGDEDTVEAACSSGDQIAALQRQHGNPVFNDTDQWAPGGRLYNQRMANNLEPIFIDGHGQAYEDVDGWFGRPTEADAQDIAFLLHVLESHLPENLKAAIGAQSLDTLIKTRSQNGENALLQELEKCWYIMCPGTVVAPGSPIKTLQDIKTIIEGNRRKFTPACHFDVRHYVGLDHPCRPYLTEYEEMAINEGISDYNMRNWEITFKPSFIREVTKGKPEHALLESYERIPDWMEDIDQGGLLDPNAFHECPCGQVAMSTLGSYRDEKEHNYKEMKGFESAFPIEVLDGSELHDAMADLVQFPDYPEHATPHRSQEIVQNCELHKTITKNIFVLVDTSVEDLNERISHPAGLLPAPGITSSSYPSGFQTTIGFSEIPYPLLAPRCEHGRLHQVEFTPQTMASRMMNASQIGCTHCFPHGHIVTRCQECLEHCYALAAPHGMWAQLDAAYHPTVDFAQEQHQGHDLAQNVQSRRAKALIAGTARGTLHSPGMSFLGPLVRSPADLKPAGRQQYANFPINPDFEAAMQRANWE
ncbi:uncharacterized protein J4E88_007098 [Alternaria novae-zelandiae]|uniref:uncharacterized protein n=1 Tax=Alternaria novae-zelandiae TaxID=430562 RepID=UPI0020C33B04|nr:uncharacterized protein J4E88_007098 [Alternaria novae-zelandiae]KAI4677290.1 hypothetical protein J4E88_007098 [Alternaria novae-zelandiae]